MPPNDNINNSNKRMQRTRIIISISQMKLEESPNTKSCSFGLKQDIDNNIISDLLQEYKKVMVLIKIEAVDLWPALVTSIYIKI